ncbi:uncharacterized protein METZ01_LOCUS71154 [marine metagenome]|uniref:Uncharacterized protein n=1 Tax=marine metagenome TaxID=408172 RepID=A0A381TQJ6_9ZZZZ
MFPTNWDVIGLEVLPDFGIGADNVNLPVVGAGCESGQYQQLGST